MFSKTGLVALLALAHAALGQVVDPGLIARLRSAPTHPDRINLLKDEQFVFNFLGHGVGESTGDSGRTISANSGNFPALIGNGIAMTYGFLGPCGMNIPHTHPRATEINIAINGTLRTGMLAENGARFVFNNVPAGSVTVFPRGAVHFEMNTECHDTLFIAAFNDEDPGTLALAQRFFGLPADIVMASLDSIGIKEIIEIEAKIPNNVAQGTLDCLKRCGIHDSDTQPTSQRQPRVPGNAIPAPDSYPEKEPWKPEPWKPEPTWKEEPTWKPDTWRPEPTWKEEPTWKPDTWRPEPTWKDTWKPEPTWKGDTWRPEPTWKGDTWRPEPTWKDTWKAEPTSPPYRPPSYPTHPPTYTPPAYPQSSYPPSSMPTYVQQPGNKAAVKGAVDNDNLSQLYRDNNLRPFLIAFLVLNAVFVVGVLTALFLWIAKKRGGKQERLRGGHMGPQFAPLRDGGETEYYDPYHPPHGRATSPMAPEKQ